jgi:hypothetical protein
MIERSQSSSSQVADCLDTVIDATSTINNLSQFMLLSINRFIDCAHIAHDGQLIPYYSNISFQATLSKTIQVMNSIQTKVKINPHQKSNQTFQLI